MIFCSGIGIAWSMAAIFWAAQGEKFLVPVGRWVPVKNNYVVGNPGPLSIILLEYKSTDRPDEDQCSKQQRAATVYRQQNKLIDLKKTKPFFFY
jgi:hypothetical protein